MEDPDRAQTRLSNIQSVQPILSALRTISLGSWQAALKQLRVAHGYQSQLRAMLPAVLPHLSGGSTDTSPPSESNDRSTLLVIGSERGLCGRFNHILAEKTEQILSQHSGLKSTVSVWALGGRLARTLQQRQISPTRLIKIPKTLTEINHLAYRLTNNWLNQYQRYEVAQIQVLLNTYQGMGRYRPKRVDLIPPSLTAVEDAPEAISWPPIIETEPLRLYSAIVVQLTAVTLYSLMLDSAAAEHSARFQLMEAATQNTERLIESLSIDLQTARRQAITQEMQILASGAGLLKP